MYEPEYAPGEVYVILKDPDSSFARSLGKLLGYECLDDENMFGAYLFKVPAGDEDKACRRFGRYRRFVDSAFRRDLRFERRSSYLDGIIADLREVPVEDEDFARRLSAIAHRLKPRAGF